MTTPARRILDAFEAQRGEPANFQGATDAEAYDAYVREHVLSHGTKVNLMRMGSGTRLEHGKAPLVDPLDGDTLDPEFKEEQVKINMPCIVEQVKSRQLKTKFGVKELKAPVFYFSHGLLKDAGLVDPLRFRGVEIGDLIEWDATWYRVESSHREGYLGQSNQFFMIMVTTKRHEQNTVDLNARTDP